MAWKLMNLKQFLLQVPVSYPKVFLWSYFLLQDRCAFYNTQLNCSTLLFPKLMHPTK
jgi:hypothetical protein